MCLSNNMHWQEGCDLLAVDTRDAGGEERMEVWWGRTREMRYAPACASPCLHHAQGLHDLTWDLAHASAAASVRQRRGLLRQATYLCEHVGRGTRVSSRSAVGRGAVCAGRLRASGHAAAAGGRRDAARLRGAAAARGRRRQGLVRAADHRCGPPGLVFMHLLQYLHLFIESEPVLLRRLVDGRAWLCAADHRCRRLGFNVQALRDFAGLCC